ncbi:transmembrane domain-containing protein TMIGD3 isoform X2 [Vicugna pacos]|uniref:Transmembrane domain-containing protein TMIGD3 isoform X2 n=2 Tax=Vicugna pacos TaxID=30538 RepID=A0ABM5DTA1_VICPA
MREEGTSCLLPKPDPTEDRLACALLPSSLVAFESRCPSLWVSIQADAMVMDEKVKERFVLDTTSAVCSYDARYKDHPKYWCRGYLRDFCSIIAFAPNSTNRVALRDTGDQLIVTVSCLSKEDVGWYWCGIQRDFARDDMDFTKLLVTDNRRARANSFWPGKGHMSAAVRGASARPSCRPGHSPSGGGGMTGKDLSGNKNRSCRASRVVDKADHFRMSIFLICILITSLGSIFVISHLSKRRGSRRTRRVIAGKGLAGSQKTSQAASGIPMPLATL